MTEPRTLTVAREDGEVERFVVVGETGVRKRGRTEKGFAHGYVYIFQDALRRLAADRGVKWVDYRVLMAYLSMATLERPEWPAEPQVVGELLEMDPSEVSRSTSRLVARGYLRRPRRGVLALVPEVAWRGTAAGRARAMKDDEP